MRVFHGGCSPLSGMWPKGRPETWHTAHTRATQFLPRLEKPGLLMQDPPASSSRTTGHQPIRLATISPDASLDPTIRWRFGVTAPSVSPSFDCPTLPTSFENRASVRGLLSTRLAQMV
jgi:hypothetical protein